MPCIKSTLFPLVKGLNIILSSNLEIPIPKSVIEITVYFFSDDNSIVILLASRENFIALLNKLIKIFCFNFSSIKIVKFFNFPVVISFISRDFLQEWYTFSIIFFAYINNFPVDIICLVNCDETLDHYMMNLLLYLYKMFLDY